MKNGKYDNEMWELPCTVIITVKKGNIVYIMLHLKVGSEINQLFLEIIMSYVDKFNVFYYADNLSVHHC